MGSNKYRSVGTIAGEELEMATLRLDDAVHDAVSSIASVINGDGLEAQVAYLRANGWSDEDIVAQAGADVFAGGSDMAVFRVTERVSGDVVHEVLVPMAQLEGATEQQVLDHVDLNYTSMETISSEPTYDEVTVTDIERTDDTEEA